VPYTYLVAAVVSLGMLGVLHKVADYRKCRPEAVNLYLFLWAGCLLFTFTLVRSGPSGPFSVAAPVVLVAAVCGICAGLAVLNFQRAIRAGRISTSWLIINLSSAVPTALAIVIYHEELTWKRAISLMLAVVALMLLWIDRRREEASQAS
jgi:drug/metabolite transporter (DMT)-like permease